MNNYFISFNSDHPFIKSANVTAYTQEEAVRLLKDKMSERDIEIKCINNNGRLEPRVTLNDNLFC